MKNEDNSKQRLTISSSPHIHKGISTKSIMYLVFLALLLPSIGSVYFFGVYSILIILVSTITAVLTEFAAKTLRNQEFKMDGSALVTGVLLALLLPPRVPLWTVVIGSGFSIAIAKEAFGGLGFNIFNPAFAGRAFLSLSFPELMSRWIEPVSSLFQDAVTAATPLSQEYATKGIDIYLDLFLGRVGGSLGETSALLILVGGLILYFTDVIDIKIPFTFIGSVFLVSLLIPGIDPLYQILSGGVFLAGFFMVTDYVTTPNTLRGKLIFASGAGLLVVLIRVYGSLPGGSAYSILLMNAFTPLIDRYTKPNPYGFIQDNDGGEENEG